MSNNINIKNRRATFDYEIIETFTAGIVLTGTEIKSIRLGKKKFITPLLMWNAKKYDVNAMIALMRVRVKVKSSS